MTLSLLKHRKRFNRPLDSYSSGTHVPPRDKEGTAKIDGFQLYQSMINRQTWLIHTGDLKKRGFVGKEDAGQFSAMRALINQKMKKREVE